MKAQIIKKKGLAYIITEAGQKAVVPWDNLCDIIKRFKLTPVFSDDVKLSCIQSTREIRNREVEMEYEAGHYEYEAD